MPNSATIQKKILDLKSPALMLETMNYAAIGAGELGPNKEYVLVYSVQRNLKILESSGATPDQALDCFENSIKTMAVGPGAPIFIDELTNE